MINIDEQNSKTSIIDLKPDNIVVEPFPHVIKQPFLNPDFYQRLKEEFPANELFDGRPQLIGSRTGRDLFKGDAGFDEFLEKSPSWKEFHDYINSPSFLNLALELFGPHLSRFECRVDPNRAKLVDYTEDRFSLWWRSKQAKWLGLGRRQDPNDLFVRFDIEQSTQGYKKPVHCDWSSRLLSLIIYFCDADEIGMDGGNLHIHKHLESKPYSQYERHPKEENTEVIQTLRPQENLGVFFLCSNNSYHSVNAINSIKDYRRFIYLNVSSTAQNIW
ncbi:MAG: 2OG-Fe(II) oxygenase [Symploca sp. SIO2C1]|nr:2OG-Fe(II) oxygenase [Symploca sp. SIO2C1]